MKKFIPVFGYVVILVILGLVLFSSEAIAQEKDSAKNVISARGTASGEYSPDTARVTLAVETEAKKLSDAINKNNEIAEKINNNVKKLLGEDDSLKTTNFQVHPVYTYDKNDEPARKLTGYKVTNQITVKTSDIRKPGQIIEAALNSGANRVAGLNYEISDTQKICNTLLQEAVQDARGEAEALAKALGVKITGISKVSSSCNEPYDGPSPVRGMGVEMLKVAPPLEAGESTVSAQVFVDFIIE